MAWRVAPWTMKIKKVQAFGVPPSLTATLWRGKARCNAASLVFPGTPEARARNDGWVSSSGGDRCVLSLAIANAEHTHEKARPRNHGAVPGAAGTGSRSGGPVRQGGPGDRVGRTRERGQEHPGQRQHSEGAQPLLQHGKMLEQGKADMYNACEWGNYCRVQDTQVGSRQVGRRHRHHYAAIVVRPDSEGVITAQQLAGKTVGVPFYFGTHYLALHLLEGFMPREDNKLCRTSNGSRPRFDAMMRGEIEATTLTEPYVTLGRKAGCRLICEAFITAPKWRRTGSTRKPTGAFNRAVREAVKRNQRRQGEVPALLHRLSREEGRRHRRAQAAGPARQPHRGVRSCADPARRDAAGPTTGSRAGACWSRPRHRWRWSTLQVQQQAHTVAAE